MHKRAKGHTAGRAASDLLWPSVKHVVDSLLRTLRSSWKSCLIFEQICSVTAVSPTHKSFGFKAKFKFKGVTQNRTTVIEGDNLTKISDEGRDGMETTQDP